VTVVTSAISVRPISGASFDWSADAGPAADLRRVLVAATTHDGRAPLNEAALLSLRHDGLAGSTLFTVASPGAGAQAAGFAWLHSGDLDVVVDPAVRRRGLGAALVEAALSAGPAGAPSGAPSRALSAWSPGNHPGAAALAARFGFARVRDLWVMRRAMRVELPPLPDSGAVAVRPFRPDHDEAAFLAVNAAAFAHHPEQGSLDLAALEQREAEDWFDPAGFFLAFSGEDLVGYHWTKVHSATTGEVYVVGVAPAAQGSGLGKLLTLTGLHHLRDRGVDEVILYVEADNAPAIAVYSGLGFTHAPEDTDVQYRREP
jgi:mycothiol synthase